MKKILITGANGMVGKNLVEHKYSENYELLTPDRKTLNLLDTNSVTAYVAKYQPDIVIHCAGIVGGIQANISQPVKFLVENMQIGLNIIMSAKLAGVKRFMNLSSSCMYPRDAQNPLTEDLILKGELEPTNEGYALSKITSTRLCDYISREDSSFSYKTVIPCNLYGRHDKFDVKNSHMIPAVIRKIHQAKVKSLGSVDIWGDGLARREFMYAGDLADFVYYAVENFERMPQNINVGLGHDYTINEYYAEVARVIGFDGNFIHDLSKPVGMRQKLIDDSRLKTFGWRHKTSLTDGIYQAYNYFMEQNV